MQLNTGMSSIYVFKTGFVIPKLYSILTLIKDCHHQIFIFYQYSVLNNDIHFFAYVSKPNMFLNADRLQLSLSCIILLIDSRKFVSQILLPFSSVFFFFFFFFFCRKKFDSLFMFFLPIFQLKYKQFIYTESVTVRSPTTSYEKIFQSFAG